MTSNFIIKKLDLHDVSLHRNCYQNRFINEYNTNNLILVGQSDVRTKFFFVRCRRTYILTTVKRIKISIIFSNIYNIKLIFVLKIEKNNNGNKRVYITLRIQFGEGFRNEKWVYFRS